MRDGNFEKLCALMTGRDFWNSATEPPIRFSDGPTGVRSQDGSGDHLGLKGAREATCFPTHSALACSWNTELAREVGASIGKEASERGVDVLLAPGLNIKRSPLCGRNFEYFSEDPYLAGKLGAAYSAGVNSIGVGTCVKHFAANNREYGRMVCDSAVDERTLREIYLTAFEIAVKEGKPAAVMTAYNRLNGVYCNENSHLIRDILRGEWGFDGIVISDWGGTHDRASAIAVGADLEMPGCAFTPEEIKRAADAGILSEKNLNDCAQRLIKLSHRDKTASSAAMNGGECAVKSAAECAVLLKNNGILPLTGNGKIVLVGDFAQKPLIQGGGSSNVNTVGAESLRTCMENVAFVRGYRADGKASRRLSKRALKVCGEADTVIFCAGQPDGDCEGADRKNLYLPENQTSLLKSIYGLGKRVAVVLYGGSAVDTSWDGGADALLYVGLAGQGGAKAAADILYGRINPSGKLAESFPRSLSDLPVTGYYNDSAYYTVYGEGMAVGYRHLCGTGAKYPFGFGLSYTSFEYSDLETDEEGVSFNIKNTGILYGGEIAQLYIAFPESANAPKLQLKGFGKYFLAPGESVRARICFDEYTFRSWDSIDNRWVKVRGEYGICVGASSESSDLIGKIYIDGESAGVPPSRTDGLMPAGYPLAKDKKGRITVDRATPFCELKNARGLFGRIFAKAALFAVRKNPTIRGSLEYLPIRTLAQFGRFTENRLNGLIMMFNGRFFRGLHVFLKKK